MRITAIESTDLFVGSDEQPLQVVRVHVERDADDVPARLEIQGEGLRTLAPVTVSDPGSGVVEIGVTTTPAAGTSVAARVLVDGRIALAENGTTVEGTVDIAEPGWTMHMVSHFHYDPVWWNTQAAYTSEWDALDFENSPRAAFQHSGFDLVRAHMGLAREDPDYCFVLAEVDYLKPYWDMYPEDRSYLRRLLAQGRLELMGGTWNEPSTNLTSAELTIRNAIYGIGFQRDIMGGDPQTAWQLDVFGHDPQFPGLMADAGLTSSSWARGPFHQWGPMLSGPSAEAGDATVMQFPSEFEWLSPSGRGVLTAYMANHYSAGWDMDSAPTLDEAMEAAYTVYSGLKPVAATRNVLLPVGTDYTPPNRWVTQIHREWNARYVWPRFVCSLPRDFFAAVRAEMAERGVKASPQSRDMNPIYTGKDVSYIDTKQVQRDAECILQDAEKWATIASLLGAQYPDAALDKAWRQLIYGAHHDGITGSESDQVYLDLLAGWREAHDLAHDVHDRSTTYLAGLIGLDAAGWAVTVFNALSWQRSDIVEVPVRLDRPTRGLRLCDLTGAEWPFTLEGAQHDADGMIGNATLRFRADAVPSVGHRTWVLVPAGDLPADSCWADGTGHVITNEFHRVAVDISRGGAISELVELASGQSLLREGRTANELVVYEEYPDHPKFKEGPWHLVPSGLSVGSASTAADSVTVQESCLGQRLTVTGQVGPARYTQQITLWHGVDRVDFMTALEDWKGSDQLLRVRFPTAIPGALPVCEVANAVIGRGFGFPDVDSAEAPWTLDNPAYTWFGLGSTARVRLSGLPGDDTTTTRAIGVADVVVPTDDDGAPLARDLIIALARVGVTATTSSADGPRYGLLDVDSNLPDFRVAIGGPDRNPFTKKVLDRAGQAYHDELARQLADRGAARLWASAATPLRDVWVPNADLREAGALPVLVVAADTNKALLDELAALSQDLGDAVIDISQPGELHPQEPFEDRTVALLNRGVPSFVVDIDGVLHLSLLRSCTGWPSGSWIDPPTRTAPDGSGFQLQHWTHRFDYALAGGAGDWRANDLVRRGQGYNHQLSPVVHASGGTGEPDRSFVQVEPDTSVIVTTLKATGNPLSRGEVDASKPGERLTFRVYEANGMATRAKLRAFVPLVDAAVCDLLESRTEAIPDTDGHVELDLDGAQIETVTAQPRLGAATVAPPVRLEGDGLQLPDYSRYWLHNRGVAPTGAHPVTVHLHGPTTMEGPTTIRCTVSSDLTKENARGEVTLGAPDGWILEPASISYDVAAGEHLTTEVIARPPSGPHDGSHLLYARITDPSGHPSEDVLTVTSGSAGQPVLQAELDTDGIEVRAGQRHVVTVRLTNNADGDLNVEVQLLTPYESWKTLQQWTIRASVPGRGSLDRKATISIPGDARAGHYWLLAKVMGAGHVVYTKAIPFVVVSGDAEVSR